MTRTIKLFYIIYSAYSIYIALVSDYKLSHLMFGLLCIWLMYLCYMTGFSSVKVKPNVSIEDRRSISFPFSNIARWKRRNYFANSIICWAFAIYGARFYTGMLPTDVIRHIQKGTSVYSAYGKYYASMGLGTFSLQKVPIILMVFYVILNFYLSALQIIRKEELSVWKLVYVITIGFSFAYIGFARGTNFELYLIFVTIAFCLFSYEREKINKKTFSIVIVLGILLLFVFQTVVLSRGLVFRNNICEGIHFNEKALLSELLPVITHFAIIIFSYLGFGIYVIGYTSFELILEKPAFMLGSLVPHGLDYAFNNDFIKLVRAETQVGVRWVPDYIIFLDKLGLLFFCLLVFLMGKITKIILNSNMLDLQKRAVVFFITLEMISIPVGNFVTTSSANILCVLYVICWVLFWYFPLMLRQKRK